jgi:fucose 4-O-acetylase-like acetyltransferase
MSTDYKITRLRSLAIVTVVLGHSIILYDPQWGLYQTSYTVGLLMWMKRIINAFQMPLFLFLAGFCFFYSIEKHDYKNVRNKLRGILGKAKRLLVPFFAVALVWMIPIRLMCHYSAWDNLRYCEIFKRVLLGIDSGHLWFLPTLFMIFVIAFIIFPHVNNKNIDCLVLIISFLGSLIAQRIPAILFLNTIASSLYWFCLGFEVCKYKGKLGKLSGIKSYSLAFTSGAIMILTSLWGGTVCKVVQKMAVTFLLIALYNCMSGRKCSSICKKISDESMGVYLLHSPLVYFTYAYYANGLPAIVVFINFVIGGFVAFSLTHIIMNSKAKALLGY